MQVSLLSGLDEKQKKQFIDQFKAARPVLDQIIRVLADRFEAIERKGFNEEDYKSNDWVFLQAFNNGRLSEIKRLAELISDKE